MSILRHTGANHGAKIPASDMDLLPRICAKSRANPSIRYGICVPNFGPHVVLHGHSADGRASSQAAAHSSKVVSSASSLNIGPTYTPKDKVDLVWYV